VKAAIVVPFRADGKRRLQVGDASRRGIAEAMLLDVLAACLPLGTPLVVTDDRTVAVLAAEIGAAICDDPGGGQGGAVATALARLGTDGAVVVNADVPSVTPRDLRTLIAATPPHGIALVAADDGTTNALSLSSRAFFAPLYGPGSADLFSEHARALGGEAVSAAIPNLAHDVDDLIDLRRVGLRAGPRTQAAVATLGVAA
jgi:2-phospho-L-lactate guanylyltransferase